MTPARKKAAATARKSSSKVAKDAAADGVADLDADIAAAVERLTAALAKEGGLDAAPPREKGFGSGTLRAGGKIFAMPHRGALVVKLPKDRVAELIGEGSGGPFATGERVMKEWVALKVDERHWLPLAREARDYVKRGAR